MPQSQWNSLKESWDWMVRSYKLHPEPDEAIHSAIFEVYLIKAEELLAKWGSEQATVLEYNLESFRKSQCFDVPTEEVMAIYSQLDRDFNLKEGYSIEIIASEWVTRKEWRASHATP